MHPSSKQNLTNGEASPRDIASATGTPGRKQLPSIPDQSTQLSLASRMAAEKRNQNPKGNHSYGPFFMEYSLLAEYNLLQKQKLPGVYVIPSAKSAIHWNGVLFIRQGLYQGGAFKFSLHIPENYPDEECPKLIFEQPVFHPVIDPVSGELDVKRAFKKWRRNVNHIWEVLLYARRIFYKIETKSPLNPEACVLYEQEPSVYKQRVSECIKSCTERLYDPPSTDDPHAIRFSPWDPSVHDEARRQMLEPKSPVGEGQTKNAQTSGLSWVKSDSMQILSRDDPASA